MICSSPCLHKARQYIRGTPKNKTQSNINIPPVSRKFGGLTKTASVRDRWSHLIFLCTQSGCGRHRLQLCRRLFAEYFLQKYKDVGRLGGRLNQHNQATVPGRPREVVCIQLLFGWEQLESLPTVKSRNPNVIWEVVLRVHHFSLQAACSFLTGNKKNV